MSSTLGHRSGDKFRSGMDVFIRSEDLDQITGEIHVLFNVNTLHSAAYPIYTIAFLSPSLQSIGVVKIFRVTDLQTLSRGPNRLA